jgi:glutaredoxin
MQEASPMAAPPVTIYSLTTCSWSAKAKAFFKQQKVNAFVFDYDQVSPELQRKISEEMRRHGADGFPFVKIGRGIVKGYDPAAYNRLLGKR